MKKYLFFIGLIFFLLGCIKPKNNFPDPTSEPPYLEVRSDVILQNSGGVVEIDISTNDQNWTASKEESWVELELISGTPGKLRITLPANIIMEERLANVKITANDGKIEKILRVIQYGTEKKISFAQGTSLSIPSEENTFNLGIVTNCPTFDIVVTYEGTDSDWMTYTAPEIPASEFEIRTLVYEFQATVNSSTEAQRVAKIKVIGTELAEGVMAEFVVTQSPTLPPTEQLTASFLSYDGVIAKDLTNLFDKNYGTFGETGYGEMDGAEKRTLEINIPAEALTQIKFYPRNYSSPTILGNVHQYPADFELWVQKTGAGWEQVPNVFSIRGEGNLRSTQKYGDLTASQVPYLIYDGVLSNVQKVRLVITGGNSKSGNQNNQFWNASEIEFWGVPSTVVEPVEATITNATYSWVSSTDGVTDGGNISVLYDGTKESANYWQTHYGDISAEDGNGMSTEDAVADGTTLTFTLDKPYPNFSEIWWYPRSTGQLAGQSPKTFDILVDSGSGQFVKVKSFTNLTFATNPTKIILDTPVKAKAFQIYVKETSAIENKMFMSASEVEAYIQP